MQAQQALRNRQQSVSLVFAIVGIAIAATVALAIIFTATRPATLTTSTAVTLPEVGTQQIAHNRSENGLGGSGSIGGEQVAHNRSEEGLANR